MKKLKAVLVKIGKIVGGKLASKILNAILIVYGLLYIVGGIFYDVEVNATSAGVWVLLVVFNSVMHDKTIKSMWELVDNQKELVDMLVEHNNRLRKELTKNKK